MHKFNSSKIQIRVLVVAFLIVLFVSLTGCAGNYTLGDSTKLYCQAVELQKEIPKKVALSQEADGSGVGLVEAIVDL